MIIAIDGPAGAGKSTTARAVAKYFGFAYVDTGAMYRAVALAALEAGLKLPDDENAIIEVARALPIAIKDNGQSTWIGPRDVSALIRSPQVAQFTSQISTISQVRMVIVEKQQQIARDGEKECGGAVLEGRDIQTVVFPDAEAKIFLTADPRTRASRRLIEWQNKGESVDLAAAEEELRARDERDMGRETSPLRAAEDAVVVATDGNSCEEVVEQIAQIVRAKMKD